MADGSIGTPATMVLSGLLEHRGGSLSVDASVLARAAGADGGPDRRMDRSAAAFLIHTSSACRPDRSLPIAMFDSGVGGLTVLHECLVSLPSEDFLYLGDSANFPYGTKTHAELRGPRRAQHRVPARARDEAADHRLQLGDVGRRRRGARDRLRAWRRGRHGDRARGRDRRRDHRDRAGRRPRHPGDRRGRRLPPRAGAAGPRARGDRGRGARPRADHPERLPVRRVGRRDGPLVLPAACGRRTSTP